MGPRASDLESAEQNHIMGLAEEPDDPGPSAWLDIIWDRKYQRYPGWDQRAWVDVTLQLRHVGMVNRIGLELLPLQMQLGRKCAFPKSWETQPKHSAASGHCTHWSLLNSSSPESHHPRSPPSMKCLWVQHAPNPGHFISFCFSWHVFSSYHLSLSHLFYKLLYICLLTISPQNKCSLRK